MGVSEASFKMMFPTLLFLPMTYSFLLNYQSHHHDKSNTRLKSKYVKDTVLSEKAKVDLSVTLPSVNVTVNEVYLCTGLYVGSNQFWISEFLPTVNTLSVHHLGVTVCSEQPKVSLQSSVWNCGEGRNPVRQQNLPFSNVSQESFSISLLTILIGMCQLKDNICVGLWWRTIETS